MKKRLLDGASLLALAVAALLALRLTTGSPAVHAGPSFENFPVGGSVPVSFRFDQAFHDFSALETRNQMRDWVLYSVMSDTGLSPGALRKALYDMPPLRARYLEGVAHFDYGETRSRAIGNGEVVAVVPKSTAARRKDNLADIADREFKNSGEKPQTLHVFEYELDEAAGTARVVRQEAVEGSRLFTADYGYVEAAVRDRGEFAKFMQSVDELIAARLDAGVLYLAGRKRGGSAYRGLRPEDAAALWQSEQAIQSGTPMEGSDASRRLSGSGFSLDPTYDYEKLGALFEIMAPAIAQTSVADKIASTREALARKDEGPFLGLLSDLESSPDRIGQFLGKNGESALSATKFQHARYDGPLAGTEVGMVLFYTDLIAKLWALDYQNSAPEGQVEDFRPLLKIDSSPIYALELQKLSHTRLWFGPQDDGFQKTDAGILFAPKATRVYAASSSALKPGNEGEPNAASAAFLGWWDRHYDDIAAYEPEYQRLNEIMKWSLLLSWMSERNAMSNLSFLDAAHEPVSHAAWFPDWARNHTKLRFHDWDQIRFYPKGYKGVETESLPLLQNHWTSPVSGLSGLRGGVSLGSKDLLSERAALPKDIDPLLRRSNLNYSAHQAGAEAFQTFDKTAYEFRAGTSDGRFIVSAGAKAGAKLRSIDSEVRNAPFEYAYRREPAGLAVDVKNGDIPVGEFLVAKKGGGFLAAFHSLDLERGNEFARIVDAANQQGADVARALAERPTVEEAIKVSDGYLIRTRGTTSRWMKIGPEGAPGADISKDAQLRYAAMGGHDESRLNVAWISDRDASAQLNGTQYIVINHPGKDLPHGLAMEATNRGPPPSLGPETRIELTYGGVKVPGRQFGNDGPVYVERAKLPPNVGADPGLWSKASFVGDRRTAGSFSNAEEGEYRQAARQLVDAPGDFRAKFGEYRQRNTDSVDDMLRDGRADEARGRLDKLIATFGDDPKLVERRNTLERAADLSRNLDAVSARTTTFLEQGDLKIELRLLDLRKSAAAAAEARASGKAVYIRSDRPVPDPNPAVQQSLDHVLSGGNVVSKLVNWEIATALPEVIVDAASGAKYRLHTLTQRPSQEAGFGSWPKIPRYNPMSQDPCSSPAARALRPDCDQTVYLIDPPPALISSSRRP